MTDAPTTNDPIEIAMEAERAGGATTAVAVEVLRKQSQLIGWEIADRRAAFALKCLAGAAALLLAVVIAWMVWDASRARGLVIQAFAVPPDLAARGMTGQVAASQLLDEIGAMDAASGSVRARETMANDWGGDLEVQIPETGVSVAEVQRVLRRVLGRQTRLEGAIVRVPDGLKVTVRVRGRRAWSVTGPERDIDRLLVRAAEAAYRATQPYRYTDYLRVQGRSDEGRALLAVLATSGAKGDRPWATNALGNGAATNARAVALYEQAAALGPTLALPWLNAARVHYNLGRIAAADAALRQALARLNRRDLGGYSETSVVSTRHNTRGRVAAVGGDYGEAIIEFEAAKSADDDPIWVAYLARQQGAMLALRHEPTRARPYLAALGVSDAAVTRAVAKRGWVPILEGAEVSRAAGDWDAVLAGLAEVEPLLAEAPILRIREFVPTTIWPRRAEALAALGRLPEAADLAWRLPLDCVPCLRVRGLIAAKGGDAAGADRWYGEAVRLAPESPFALTDWAQVRLDRGDAAGALALARRAERVGPRFADAAKIEGDAHARLGRPQAAAKAYARAARFAPRWGGLHLAWGQAMARLGRDAAAREHWRSAAAMDLTPAERAELARVLR